MISNICHESSPNISYERYISSLLIKGEYKELVLYKVLNIELNVIEMIT